MKIKTRLIFLFGLLGVALLFMGGWETLIMCKEPIDVMTADPSTFENNMHVVTEIDRVYSEFLQETSYQTRNGIKVSEEKESARYYLIPLYKEDEDYILLDQFFGLRINTGMNAFDTMDTIIEETEAWWNDETGTVRYGDTSIAIEGKLREMTEEEQEYMLKFLCNNSRLSEEEVKEYIIPYVVVPVNPKNGIVMLLLGIIFTAVAILVFVIGRVFDKKREERMYMRPTQRVNEEKNYYEPEDSSMAPTAYGSTTYGTNSYGQNMYGSSNNMDSKNGNNHSIAGDNGLSQDFLNRMEEEKKMREMAANRATVAENHNPLYGAEIQKPQTVQNINLSQSGPTSTSNTAGGLYGVREDNP